MRPTQASVASTKRSSLLINHNYALLWVGQSISVIGDQVFNTTLVVWIGAVLTLHLAYSALALSGVLIATALPSLLFAPIAGVFVDRWDKRRTLIVTDILRALLIAVLLPVTGLIQVPFYEASRLPLGARLGVIYAAVFAASICAQFFNPARLALIGDIVDEPSRARASGLAQTSQSIALIIGPPLAAPLLFTFGVEWALLINTISFLVSSLTILAIRMPFASMSSKPTTHAPLQREMMEGVAFTFGNRKLIAIIVSLVLVILGAGTLNTLFLYFVTQSLHVSATLYGVVGAVEGGGALAGAILAGLFARRLGLSRVYSWSIVAAAIFMFVLARMTAFIPALIVIAAIGIVEAAMNVALTPLVLQLVPRALLGRVFSLINPFIVTAGLVGTALAGFMQSVALYNFHADLLGQTFHSVDTIYLAAGIAVLLGGMYAVATLRNAEAVGGVTAPVAGNRT